MSPPGSRGSVGCCSTAVRAGLWWRRAYLTRYVKTKADLVDAASASASHGLRERNDYRLGGAFHLDDMPGHSLPRRQDNRAPDLLADPNRLEVDRLSLGHIKGG